MEFKWTDLKTGDKIKYKKEDNILEIEKYWGNGWLRVFYQEGDKCCSCF